MSGAIRKRRVAQGTPRALRLAQRWWLAALLLVACGEGPIVVLGDRGPPRYRFEEPRLITELSDAAKTDNPSLTADMREIYFTSERDGTPANVYVARRPARIDAFGEPQRVETVSTAGLETSPVVSADGLTLWVASERSGGLGGLDIWATTRAARDRPWTSPQNVEQLNSTGQDIPRPLGWGERIMPMSSDRATAPYYQVQFATRDGAATPFDSPVPVAELAFPEQSTVDAFLTDDGLTLLYVTGPAFGPADLYITHRRSTDDPFEAPVPIDDLNSAWDERDPWLSPDHSELYFSSDRGGQYNIYVAAVYEAAPESPGP